MDFAAPPVVVDALQGALAAGDLGYPDWRGPVGGALATDVFIERCARRYGWHIDQRDTMELNDVVQGIQIVLHLCTEPGDRVVVHTPVSCPTRDRRPDGCELGNRSGHLGNGGPARTRGNDADGRGAE